MITQRLNYARAVELLRLLRTAAFEIVPLEAEDYKRIEATAIQYVDAEFDFTDMAIMALSERLQVTRVYTFDRRDFAQFRPKHTSALDF